VKKSNNYKKIKVKKSNNYKKMKKITISEEIKIKEKINIHKNVIP